jgi:tetratricopeptide (TPR) repeat protein
MVYTEDRELPEEKRIIQKHNGIYNPIFVNFLRSAMFSIEQQRVDRVPTEELLETLAAQRSELGNDHPGTLKTMSFLADRYRAEGRYEEAESLQLEALTTQRDVLGDDHQDTLHTMSFLADLYKEQHRYEQAGRLYLEIYNSRDASAMDEDWNVAVSLYNLACFEAVRGNRKDAMDWLRRAVKERSSIVDLMIEDPELDSLHGPEFDALANSARGN